AVVVLAVADFRRGREHRAGVVAAHAADVAGDGAGAVGLAGLTRRAGLAVLRRGVAARGRRHVVEAGVAGQDLAHAVAGRVDGRIGDARVGRVLQTARLGARAAGRGRAVVTRLLAGGAVDVAARRGRGERIVDEAVAVVVLAVAGLRGRTLRAH